VEASNESFYAGTIGQLSDRHEIWSCIVRYARGVDRLDEDLILSAFWPDAHDAHGHINGSPQNFLDPWLPTQKGREVSQHFVSNHFVDLDGDGAESETYFQVAIKTVDVGSMELLGGRYLDHFEKRAGQWRIAERLVLVEWQCVTDASAMQERLSQRHRGVRGRDDPSYERPMRRRQSLASTLVLTE
jgi:hypothetical protein